MQRSELKPCPFCGGKAQYGKETDEFGVSHHFVGCGCIEGCFSSGSTEEQAIEAWNKRPNPWHTGTPTEEGWYVCKMKGTDLYETEYFTGVNWDEEIIEKWQKIEETD